MPRNTMMTAIGLLAVGALVTASMGLYRTFSFVAAAFILAVVASASIEHRGSLLEPYTGLVAGLAGMFVLGLAGIWLLWNPGVTSYTYALGVPRPTLVYFAFLWLAPALAAIYYSLIFDRIGSEAIVDDIISEARDRQQRADLPLTPRRIDRATRGDGRDGTADAGDDDD
ncbi:hypothetical protein [Natrinema longum]|uniref:Uncharacterized protein n=1 Tax=Natrinema longum TaxID=370324 RepID=A0A8A2UA79_9EURY|nr:hypothetical protein [Natrinema longum]MBZ6496560.1 hypothetical protein [Natrinema longum]QSW85537.1 hypothetical protein J0X27_01455 [Natrinema longum]